MRLGVMGGDEANKTRSVQTGLIPLMMNGSKPPIVPRPMGMRSVNTDPIPIFSTTGINSSNEAWSFQAHATRFYHSGRPRGTENTPVTDANHIRPIVISPKELEVQIGRPASAAVKPPEGVVDSDMMTRHGLSIDPSMDTRRAKRVLSNRLSAQRSRFRKLDYLINVEKRLRDLQAEIIALTPRIENERNEKAKLEMENILLKEKLAFLEKKTKLSNEEIEKNREEVQRLREIHIGQQCKAATVAQGQAMEALPEIPGLPEISGSMDHQQNWDIEGLVDADHDNVLEEFELEDDDPIMINNFNFGSLVMDYIPTAFNS